MNILIIGATSGIGRELSIKYAYTNLVIATGRRIEELDKLEQLSSNITICPMDINNLLETKQILNNVSSTNSK